MACLQCKWRGARLGSVEEVSVRRVAPQQLLKGLRGLGGTIGDFLAPENATLLVLELKKTYLVGLVKLGMAPDNVLALVAPELTLTNIINTDNQKQINANYWKLGKVIDEWSTTLRERSENGERSWEDWVSDAGYHQQAIRDALGQSIDFSTLVTTTEGVKAAIVAASKCVIDPASCVKPAADAIPMWIKVLLVVGVVGFTIGNVNKLTGR